MLDTSQYYPILLNTTNAPFKNTYVWAGALSGRRRRRSLGRSFERSWSSTRASHVVWVPDPSPVSVLDMRTSSTPGAPPVKNHTVFI
jgi:hypothetical protein